MKLDTSNASKTERGARLPRVERFHVFQQKSACRKRRTIIFALPNYHIIIHAALSLSYQKQSHFFLKLRSSPVQRVPWCSGVFPLTVWHIRQRVKYAPARNSEDMRSEEKSAENQTPSPRASSEFAFRVCIHVLFYHSPGPETRAGRVGSNFTSAKADIEPLPVGLSPIFWNEIQGLLNLHSIWKQEDMG